MVVSLGSPTTWVELSSSKTCAAGLGLATHLILKNGDWDHTAHKILYAWGVGIVAISTVGYTFDHNIASMGHAIQVYSSIVAVYFGVLLTSILIYRAFFHRLNRACLASSTVKTITDTTLQFPGPFLLRLSKLGNITYVLPNRQWHMAAENLHTEYKSDIIRIGPRELSIIDAEAIPLVHGPFSKCRKGPFYGFMEHIEGFSVHTTPSKQEHKERRKLWDKALSTKSLRDYEPRLNRYAYSLVSKLHEHTKEPSVRLSDWVNFYSFDVMGDIGYSHKFEMLENGNEGHLIGTVHKGMVPLSVFNHLPWALSLFTRFGSVKDILDFSAWTASTLKARKKITPKEKDIFGWLLDPEDDHVPQHLIADSKLLTVAGSDTTAATLTWLFYELCKDLAVQAKLRDAVDQIKPEKVFLDADDLTDCPYLDGAINEALRLHPAVR